MEKKLNWLKQISEVAGISGFETPVKQLLIDKLAHQYEVNYDKLGSVIFSGKEQKELKVMLAAHMDEVGFMVKTITKEGFLKFVTIGGWWEQILLGQRVDVLTSNGVIPGVIGSKPPHILSPDERKKLVQKADMYIDIGAKDDKEALEVFGVKPGCAVVPCSKFTVMANDKMLLGKAWDDRIGCAIMAEVMENIALKNTAATVYGVGTVQEEVGLRGAQTSVKVIDPDIAFIIDTCVAGDVPGVTEDKAAGKLGRGIGITIYDASMIPHIKLRDYVINIAEKYKIPYQLVFSEGGGTDAGRIHLNSVGVPSIVLSIPTRYIHSHNGIIHLDDYNAGVSLLTKILEDFDKDCYKELLK